VCDGAEVLELIEEALDEVALTIEREVARRWIFRLALGGMTAVIPVALGVDETRQRRMPCRKQGIWFGVLDQGFRAGKIMSLSRCEHQLDRIAQASTSA